MIDPGKLRYVTDCEGRRIEVIVPIEEFEELMDQVDDLLDRDILEERRNEDRISREEFRRLLVSDGKLDD